MCVKVWLSCVIVSLIGTVLVKAFEPTERSSERVEYAELSALNVPVVGRSVSPCEVSETCDMARGSISLAASCAWDTGALNIF